MTRPDPATPVLYGPDARRIQDEMRLRAADPARKNALKVEFASVRQQFKMVTTIPAEAKKRVDGE